MIGSYPNKPTLREWYSSLVNEWFNEKRLVIHDSFDYDEEPIENLDIREFISDIRLKRNNYRNNKFDKIVNTVKDCMYFIEGMITEDGLEDKLRIGGTVFLDTGVPPKDCLKEAHDITLAYKTPVLSIINLKNPLLIPDFGFIFKETDKYYDFFGSKNNFLAYYHCMLENAENMSIMDRYVVFML